MSNLTGKPIELSIVVPTYMEAENIPMLVEEVENALKDVSFELIIVDDNSPDGTATLAERLNGKYGNIKVLRRPGKLGLGSAVLEGFREAKSDVLAVMDADLQHPPELLPQMYRKICEGYSLVVASRYVDGGGVEGWSFFRRLISWGAVKLAHLFLPRTSRIKDPISGYFMLNRSVVDNVKLNPIGYKVLLEILVKGKYNSIIEIPYSFKPRCKGESKLKLKEVENYVRHVFRLFIETKKHERTVYTCEKGDALKILFLNRGVFPIPRESSGGGAESHGYLLAKELGKKHKICFVTRVSRQIDMGRNIEVLPIVFNRTYIPPTTGFFGWILKHLFANLFITFQALRVLTKSNYGFDIIHSHGNLSALLMSFFRGKVPLVYTVHDSTPWVGHYTSKFERFIRKIAFICVELPAWKRADYIIAVNKEIQREAVRFGISKDKCSVIPSGVVTQSSDNMLEIGKEFNSYGLFVGRIEARKGIEYLLEALSEMDVDFVIVGDGPELNRYRQLAQELQLSRVKFTGFVAQSDLERIFSNASYFVLPSTSEGTPIAVLEAMGYGLPVIASRVGGLNELIVNGVNGFLVTPGNVSELREKIRLLAHNPELCQRLGRNAKHLIEQKYSISKIAKEVERVYRKLAVAKGRQ